MHRPKRGLDTTGSGGGDGSTDRDEWSDSDEDNRSPNTKRQRITTSPPPPPPPPDTSNTSGNGNGNGNGGGGGGGGGGAAFTSAAAPTPAVSASVRHLMPGSGPATVNGSGVNVSAADPPLEDQLRPPPPLFVAVSYKHTINTRKLIPLPPSLHLFLIAAIKRLTPAPPAPPPATGASTAAAAAAAGAESMDSSSSGDLEEAKEFAVFQTAIEERERLITSHFAETDSKSNSNSNSNSEPNSDSDDSALISVDAYRSLPIDVRFTAAQRGNTPLTEATYPRLIEITRRFRPHVLIDLAPIDRVREAAVRLMHTAPPSPPPPPPPPLPQPSPPPPSLSDSVESIHSVHSLVSAPDH